MIQSQIRRASLRFTHTEKKNWSKVKWYPIPAYIGIAWIAALHLSHRYQDHVQKDARGVEVEGPFYLRLYASLPLRILSRAWGYANSIELPVALRPSLFKLYAFIFGCNLDEMENQNLKSYTHLSDFFYRKLAPGAREISNELLISPADGKVLSIGKVQDDVVEQVKGVTYSLDALLGSKADENDSNFRPTQGNSLFSAVIYLAPGDYHRFHSPSDWKIHTVRHFAGELFSVSPMMAKALRNLFVLNERVAMIGSWRYGLFTMTPVGATNVGSIVINSCPKLKTNLPCNEIGRPLGTFIEEEQLFDNVERGQELGGFRLGSTIVLVFEAPNDFQFTVYPGDKVKYGQAIGKLDNK